MIRDHSNLDGPEAKGIYVQMDQMSTRNWTEVSYSGLVCLDDNLSPRASRDPEVEEHENIVWSSGRHFYGIAPFRKNYILRYYTQDWDGDRARGREDRAHT